MLGMGWGDMENYSKAIEKQEGNQWRTLLNILDVIRT